MRGPPREAGVARAATLEGAQAFEGPTESTAQIEDGIVFEAERLPRDVEQGVRTAEGAAGPGRGPDAY
ncbi:hypothetical protein [Salinibacter sp.]|uniref:hypothetical protein n=1 Tax=Salinibacter sp. TaxID=2065818 RepID=UPI0021E8B195|nr:hypothetical protein [Salinibacter sp.]